MNVRWLWFDYSDPELPLTLRQRLRIAFGWAPIWKFPARVWVGRIKFFICFVPLALLPQFSLWLLLHESVLDVRWVRWMVLLPLLWLPVFWIGASMIYGWTCRRENYYRIRFHGYEICTECGYWLRGLSDDVNQCPECGAAREAMPGGTT